MRVYDKLMYFALIKSIEDVTQFNGDCSLKIKLQKILSIQV